VQKIQPYYGKSLCASFKKMAGESPAFLADPVLTGTVLYVISGRFRGGRGPVLPFSSEIYNITLVKLKILDPKYPNVWIF
jgi:hypothetical protein